MANIDCPVPAAYLASYRAHVTDTRAHIYGLDGPLEESECCFNWSSTEQNIFFHGLRVHSRLRPDLIAEEIGTKNVVDVCAYIDALHIAAGKAGDALSRRELDITMCVTDEWVGQEEAWAAALASGESLQVAQLGSKVKSTISQLGVEARSNVPLDLDEAKTQSPVYALDKDNVLRNLGGDELKALDRIIHVEEAGAQQIAGAATDHFPVYQRSVNIYQSPPSVKHSINAGSFSSTAGQSSRFRPSETYPEIPWTLSPQSRKRIQKRLHMRRKRAQERGEEPSMDLARHPPGKKRTGIEGTGEQQHLHVNDAQLPIASPNRTLPLEPPPNTQSPGPSIPRRNPRCKLDKHFAALGITTDVLRANGFELFRLGALGNLIKCAI
jgi:hypothetical protein